MIELHPGEKILKEVRRHWLPLLARAVASIIFAALPFFLIPFVASSASAAAALDRYESHIVLLELSWILALWTAFAISWTNHYLDILIITDRRVLDIEQHSLFSRDIAELRVDNLEDVRVEMPGFLAHLFHFGNLELQTAAESKAFVLRNIERPEEVRALIAQMRETFHQQQNQK